MNCSAQERYNKNHPEVHRRNNLKWYYKHKTWTTRNCEICGHFLSKFNVGKHCKDCRVILKKEYCRIWHKRKTWMIKKCEVCGQFLPKFNTGKRCKKCYRAHYWKEYYIKHHIKIWTAKKCQICGKFCSKCSHKYCKDCGYLMYRLNSFIDMEMRRNN
jgi:hypothetical protein